VDAIRDGEEIEIDLKAGEIRCAAGTFKFPLLPETVIGIFEAGGLVAYTRNQLVGKQT